MQNKETLQRTFILDVMSGCVEHKKLLDVVINVFYGQNEKYLMRGDRSQFVGKNILNMNSLNTIILSQ